MGATNDRVVAREAPVTAEIVRLDASQTGQVGATLARAFQNDPLMVHAIPDAAERARRLPEFYTAMVRFGCLSGEVYTTAGVIEGAAVALPPGVKWAREKVKAAGLDQLARILGDEAFGRFSEVIEPEARVRVRDMAGPYWYLLLLGVEPARQGRGLGAELMKPLLERAQTEGVACYLETEQPRNVGFYRSHGFELVVDGEAAGASGVRFWTFRRMPRQ